MKKLMMTAAVAILAGTGGALADGAALVIGNADYTHAPRAVAAEADARAVAEKLTAAGYEVTLGVNLTRVQMRAAMDRFARNAVGEDQLVVFYSGHAMRMSGRTFLSPVDFNPVGPVAVAFDSAPFEALQSLASQAEQAVIFIDGAQLDGFAATTFAEPGISSFSAEAGAAIVSAAAPGWAIRRSGEGQSKFGRTIIENFLEPGTSYEAAVAASGDAIWTAGGVDGLTIVSAAEVTESAGGGDDAGVELAFWRSTESGGQAADYRAYLDAYPDGIFAAIARNRLAELVPQGTSGSTVSTVSTPDVNPAEVGEEALNLSRSERLAIQRDLTTLGYDTRGVDGVFGRGTRGAIRGWQESEGIPATGFIAAGQAKQLSDDAARETARLVKEAAEAAALSAEQAKEQEDRFWARTEQVGTIAAYERYLSRYPKGAHAKDANRVLSRARAAADREDWEEAKRLNTASAYNRYLDLHPNGKFAEIAQRRYKARQGETVANDDVRAWRQAEADNTAKAYRDFGRAYPNSRYAPEAEQRASELLRVARSRREDRLNMTARDWQSLEQRLDHLGFRVGRIDGRPDDNLRRAIFDYRRSRGLVEHQFVAQDLIDAIVKETSGASPTGQLLDKLFKSLRKN
ncbi:MAG: caspase family protein [Pikeienuella sp.]